MPSKWIDFKQLKEQLNFKEVLELYGISFPEGKSQVQIKCPFPGFEGEKKASCSINFERKIFNCFRSSRTGNVIDFALLMEGEDKDDKKALRRIALKLQAQFFGELSTAQAQPKGDETEIREADEPEVNEEEEQKEVRINEPLQFELKTLDPEHEYLKKRGFTPETIDHFGLGFTNRGMMKGRICIPLHNEDSDLVGYAGRAVNEKTEPKYLLPGTRVKDGIIYEFRKSELLYNVEKLGELGMITDLVVVEGFSDCWWLHQNGFPAVVAVMGSSCSHIQGKMIANAVHRDGCVTFMPDGDEAGIRCAVELFKRIAPLRRVKWIQLRDGKQPTDFKREELREMI